MDLKSFYSKNRTVVLAVGGMFAVGIVAAAANLSNGALFAGKLIGSSPVQSTPTPAAQQQQQVPTLVTEPTVYCSVSPSSPKIGDTVTFKGTAAGFSNNNSANFSWTGAVNTSGKTVTKTFDSAGSYSTTLSGFYHSDVLNESDTAVCTFQVTEPAVIEMPTIACGPTITNGTVGQTITWKATLSPQPSGSPTYVWTGEGLTTATGSSVGTTYDNPGVKSGSVTVNINGDIATKDCAGKVTIVEAPQQGQVLQNTQVEEEAATQEEDESTEEEEPEEETVKTESESEESTELLTEKDIVTCSFGTKEVALDKPENIIAECILSEKGRLMAEVVSGKFSPSVELKDDDVVRVLQEETSKDAKTYLFVWDLKNKLDAKVEPGDFSLVIGARPTTGYKFDYSAATVKIVAKSSELTSAEESTQESQTTQPSTQGGQQGTTEGTTTETETPKEEPKAEPSKCPGVNYPLDIEGHWAAEFIKKAYDSCLVKGYDDGTFRPNQAITRAEAVKMVLSAAGIKPIEGCYDTDCGSPFADLDGWQGPWVRAAWDAHIVEGYGPNIMGPNGAMTRAEAAALLAKAFKVPKHEGCYSANCGAGYPDNFFTDIVDMWQGPWLRALWDKGWINGTGPGKFEPNRAITRAELVKLMDTAATK